MFNYFAFGSNMSAKRMHERLGWSPSRSGAILHNYAMVFNKHSNDGGKANIMNSTGDIVEGILYFVRDKDLLILDRYEGVAANQYKRHEIVVQDKNKNSIVAISYKAINPKNFSAPTKEYLKYILDGKEFLSHRYFSKLKSTKTI